jgi:hypothetical protein
MGQISQIFFSKNIYKMRQSCNQGYFSATGAHGGTPQRGAHEAEGLRVRALRLQGHAEQLRHQAHEGGSYEGKGGRDVRMH